MASDYLSTYHTFLLIVLSLNLVSKLIATPSAPGLINPHAEFMQLTDLWLVERFLP